jgi:hypothetical protein
VGCTRPLNEVAPTHSVSILSSGQSSKSRYVFLRFLSVATHGD